MAKVPQWRLDQQRRILENTELPPGAIVANLELQAENNSYDVIAFYADKTITCVNCRAQEVWTAVKQQQYYEGRNSNVYATAIHCRACRTKIREEKAAQRERMKSSGSDKGL